MTNIYRSTSPISYQTFPPTSSICELFNENTGWGSPCEVLTYSSVNIICQYFLKKKALLLEFLISLKKKALLLEFWLLFGRSYGVLEKRSVYGSIFKQNNRQTTNNSLGATRDLFVRHKYLCKLAVLKNYHPLSHNLQLCELLWRCSKRYYSFGIVQNWAKCLICPYYELMVSYFSPYMEK